VPVLLDHGAELVTIDNPRPGGAREHPGSLGVVRVFVHRGGHRCDVADPHDRPIVGNQLRIAARR